MIKALLFDFDGIILESSEIKTLAYKKMFEQETKEVQTLMNAYHLKNMGLGRREKFEYYFSEIKRQPVSDEKIDELSERYRSLVFNEVLKAEFVPGMPDFLDEVFRQYPLYIATGTPDDEIIRIAVERNVAKYFKGIYGTPATKESIIRNILSYEGCSPEEAVFFGDAESDRMAASRTGVHFVGRVAHGSEMMGETKYKIKNFLDMAAIEIVLQSL